MTCKTYATISTDSLFSKGGTVSPEEAAQAAKRLLKIGCCQPRFYSPEVWRMANAFMQALCKQGLAEPFNYGRGKGKYNTSLDDAEILTRATLTPEISKLIIKFARMAKKAAAQSATDSAAE